jgi:hypothetical protein
LGAVLKSNIHAAASDNRPLRADQIGIAYNAIERLTFYGQK